MEHISNIVDSMSESIKKIIHEEMIGYRKENKITQENAAELLGITQARYNQIENLSDHDMGLEKLITYCNMLDSTKALTKTILGRISEEVLV